MAVHKHVVEVLDEEADRLRRGIAKTAGLSEEEVEHLITHIRRIKVICVRYGFAPYVDATGTKLVRRGKTSRTADREFIYCSLQDLIDRIPRL